MGYSTQVFNITTPSLTWQIDHNFGNKPAVDVCLNVNGTMVRAFPLGIVHNTDNRVTVTWSTHQTGAVIVSGATS